MQKKHFILIGIAVLLIAGLAYFILSRPKGEVYEEIDTIMGVPVNSELIIHIPDLEKFVENTNSKEGTWKELGHWETLRDFQAYKKEFTEALTEMELAELFDDAQLTIATKITGRDGLQGSYIFPMRTSNKRQHIEKFLRHYFKDFNTTSQEYSGFKLFRVDKDETSYFYAFAKSLFILSTARISLEDALLQISSQNSLLDKEGFQKLKKIASKSDDLNIFINGVTFPKLLALSVDEKHSRFIKELTDFTTQAGIDVSVKDNSILLNGFLYTNTDDFFYTNMLLNQEPVPLTIEEVIPANTRFWSALSLSNEDAYLDNYKRYLEQTGDIKSYRKYSTSFEKTTKLNPESFIYPLLESEIGLVISSDNILGEVANRFCIIRTKSKSETEKALADLKNKYFTQTKKKLAISQYKIDANLSYTLYGFPSANFANMMWGGMFFETQTNYCTLVDNYLIFGNSKESLKSYINHIARRKTLKYDDFYQSQKKFWIDDESTFTAYIRNGDGSFFKEYADESLKTAITEKMEYLQKFPSASIQLKTLKDMLYLNGYISYTNELRKAPETVWQSRLDNLLRMKPVMVENHKSKEQELIFQDTKNILYLVSNTGVILWKTPLDEPILGTIHQVDAYKNGKLQYLFNTKSKLYLVDRNGNNVDKFPINFRSPASNGIAVFDYDRSRDYRIFVACTDNKTYLYDSKGKINEGWKATKNEHPILQPIQHFVNASKDYIVYNDSYRNYILSRRGEVRVMPKENFQKATNSELCVAKSSKKQKCSLIATNNKGVIHFTQIDDKVTTKTLGEFSENHYFTSCDINADGANDFIFVDKNTLSVFNNSGKEIFTYEFETEQIGKPNFYRFSAKEKKIGIQAGSKIYLFNSDGSLYDGFPLEGYSEFTIGFTNDKDRQFNLFVAGNNDLLFNYAVQ